MPVMLGFVKLLSTFAAATSPTKIQKRREPCRTHDAPHRTQTPQTSPPVQTSHWRNDGSDLWFSLEKGEHGDLGGF
jgi:hypothetical protein